MYEFSSTMSLVPRNICSGELAYVFFDTETSGFEVDCDVLQFAMKCGRFEFNKYITPTKPISSYASEIHHLTNRDGKLYRDSIKLPTKCKSLVLREILTYLENLRAPCTLIAHNCPFDSPRIIRLIRQEGMENEFRNVIAGFTDTLAMLKKKYPDRRSKGAFKLTNLAGELSLSSVDAHDAIYDVRMLEAIAFHHFEREELASGSKSFDEVLARHIQGEKVREVKKTLMPLKGCVSDLMITRMATAGITHDVLIATYKRGGEEVVIELLEQRDNEKPQVIKIKKVLENILNYVKHYIERINSPNSNELWNEDGSFNFQNFRLNSLERKGSKE